MSGDPVLDPRIFGPEEFTALARPQRMLTIANEMNQASKLMGVDQVESRRSAYARVLMLADLCSDVDRGRGELREFRRFRECVAALWLDDSPRAEGHGELFYAFLAATPETAALIPYVTGLPERVSGKFRKA